jgi:hypothetical protein
VVAGEFLRLPEQVAEDGVTDALVDDVRSVSQRPVAAARVV